MGFLYYTLLSLLIFVSVLLVLLILIQKGRGGGLSGAFGGGGGSAAFGAKTGDVLTWLTSSFFAVFIILAVCLDLVVNHQYHLTTVAPTVVTSTAGQTVPTAAPDTLAGATAAPAPVPASAANQNSTPPMISTTPPSTVPTTSAAAGTVNKVFTQTGNQANSLLNAATQKATHVVKSSTLPK
jgi:preprotein translocase subunit SecG